MIYLDYNATTPTDPRVVKTMLPYFHDFFANPSSIHGPGQEARKAVEQAREKLAKMLNSKITEVYFTSGGTEADNLAIKGMAFAQMRIDQLVKNFC